MIKIYGIAASNYFSCVKTVLLEKNITFEEVTQFPSQEPDFLALSPMGKIPCIESDGHFLTETNVIFDFLEDITPEPALYPEDAYEKAKVKEIIRIVELYLDAPARRHLAHAVFGEPLDEIAFDEVRPAIERGLNAFIQKAQLNPYVAGDKFTMADISSYFMLGFTNFHTKTVYDWDISISYPEIGKYLDFIGKRTSISSVQSALKQSLIDIIESSNQDK